MSFTSDNDWQNLLQRYGAMLTDLSTMHSGSESTAPWQRFGHVPPFGENAQLADVFSNLQRHGHSWFAFCERLSSLIQTTDADEPGEVDWTSRLNDYFENFKQNPANDFSFGDSKIDMAEFNLPMYNWQQIFKTLSLSWCENTKAFDTAEYQSSWQKYFNLNDIEQNEQSRDDIQQGLGLWQEYLQAKSDYDDILSEISGDSLETLKNKLIVISTQANKVTSLRQLYTLWIESHEEAYASQVLSTDYSRRYGRLVNSLLALRKHLLKFEEELSQPTVETEKELEEIKQQQKEDKARIEELEAKLAAVTKPPRAKTKKKVKKTAKTAQNKEKKS